MMIEKRGLSGDVHICGGCRAAFSDVDSFVAHKRQQGTTCGESRQHDSLGPFQAGPAVEQVFPSIVVLSELSAQKPAAESWVQPDGAPPINPDPASSAATATAATHQRSKSRDQQPLLRCPEPGCPFGSRYAKDLVRHGRTHSGERPFRCHQCARSFGRSDKLRAHLRRHSGERPFRCDQCDYAATDNGMLKIHQRIHSGEKPFKCQLCSFAGRNSSQLSVHLRSHTGDAPFACPLCPARFKISCDLKRHRRLHTGEKPFACSQCSYRSAVRSNLASHARLMHSEAGVQCAECPFRGSSRRELRLHVGQQHRRGGGATLLRCPHCPYACDKRQALQSHLRCHSEERPFRCPACPYASKHPGNLRSHVRSKHPADGGAKREARQAARCQASLRCTLCPETFVREDSLRSHWRLHRDGVLPTTTASEQAPPEHPANTGASPVVAATEEAPPQPPRAEEVPAAQEAVTAEGATLECLLSEPARMTLELLSDKQLLLLTGVGQDAGGPLLLTPLQPADLALLTSPEMEG
ncbi:zinc finger protein 64 [Ixodes scapularis]|uniref:zinc finger protein 64 n=1 Tax=Ixodes scapularis TaxID=6945 RepID=UPI001C381E00|nr:zinc finger protein 64 [Ixodes scapularis]